MSFPKAQVRLGNSNLVVSRVAFGCWPIAGVSTLRTTREDSIATLRAAYAAGVNFFDTAFSYGYDGEADKLLAEAFDPWPTDLVLASKVGQYFDSSKSRVVDGRPATLFAQADELLARLNREVVDILYLHLPDPKVPIAESAGAISEIVRSGKARYAGVSNVDSMQLKEFTKHCPCVAVQSRYNMLQAEVVDELRAAVRESDVSLAVYWVLMKGLFAGKLSRDHQFAPEDKRLSYPEYQGAAWQRNQDLVDGLREIASGTGCTLAQLVIAWTLHQPDIGVAICGGKRASQIEETAAAMHVELTAEVLSQIDSAIAIARR